MKRAIDVAIVVSAFLLLFSGIRHCSNRPAPKLSVGSQLSIPEVKWQGAEKSLVLAVSLDCGYCIASSDFYRQLSVRAMAKGYDVIAVLPQPPVQANEWLKKNGILVSRVSQQSLPLLGIWVTPTLAVVNRNGVVQQIAAGKLTPDQESVLLGSNHLDAFPRPWAELFESLPRVSETGLASGIVTVLDVSDRATFARSKMVKGSINIPHDELGVRSRVEIPKSRPVVLNCLRVPRLTCQFAAVTLREAGFQNLQIIEQH